MISSSIRKAGPYAGDGTTTVFPFAFKVFKAEDVQVVLTDSLGTEATQTTGLNVTINANQDTSPGGTVQLATPLPIGYKLTLTSALSPLQPMQVTNGGGFFPKVLNDSADRAIILIQQLYERVNRTLSAPISSNEPLDALRLPDAASRAGRFVGFDALGRIVPVSSGGTGDSGLRLDLASPGAGSSLVSFVSGLFGAVSRSALDKMRERVSVRDFGAKGDGVTNDTVAIQRALDSGARLVDFPAGDYLHDALTVSFAYQRLTGPGAKLVRNSTTGGVTVAATARGVHFDQMRFGCRTSGMAGDNIKVLAPDFKALYCESRDCSGYPLLFLNSGGGHSVVCGVYQCVSLDPTTSFDIAFKDDPGGANTLYSHVTGTVSNQGNGDEGGILVENEVGSMSITSCQVGKIVMRGGAAAKVANCRVNGTTTILSGFATFDNNEFNNDITFGQDGATNIGSIRFSSTNVQKAGKNFTIKSNVIESTFHLGQLQATGNVLTIGSYNNDIWHNDLPVVTTLGASAGAPTYGSATVLAFMSAAGRKRKVKVDVVFASDSNLGSGSSFWINLPFTSKGTELGPTHVTRNGVGYLSMIARMLAGSNRVDFTPTSGGNTAITSLANVSYPFPWTNGDRIVFVIEAERATV